MRALKKVGYDVHGLANRTSYGVEDFKTFGVYQNVTQLEDAVKHYKDSGIDIYSFANEPDWQVKIIKKIIGDKQKLIVDLHDLDSIRRGFIPITEREMFNYGDAFVYVSMPIQIMTNELHRVDKPNIVLYSYCNEDIVTWDEDKISERKNLVYEGGANPPNDTKMNQFFAYRSLYDIIKKLVEMGNEVYMYCGNADAYKTYQHTGAVLYPPTIYNEMMSGLTKFKYGIAIFNNEDGNQNQVNYTLTNKESEYLHCGLPTIACWCPETEKHIEKHKIGFTFKHINEIGNCSQIDKEYLDVMENIKTKKKELTMENYIVLLENLYADVLGIERKGIPKKIQKLHDFEFNR